MDVPWCAQRLQPLGPRTVITSSSKVAAQTLGCIASTRAAASSQGFASATLRGVRTLDFPAGRIGRGAMGGRGKPQITPRGIRWPVFRLRAGRVAASLQNARGSPQDCWGGLGSSRFCPGLWDAKACAGPVGRIGCNGARAVLVSAELALVARLGWARAVSPETDGSALHFEPAAKFFSMTSQVVPQLRLLMLEHPRIDLHREADWLSFEECGV
jgi:hypothetical protein